MPFTNTIVKQSPAFSLQLKRALKNEKNEQAYMRELVRLAKERLAWEVAQKRKVKKWSQQELAQKIGTTQAVISRIEKGRVNAGLDIIIRLKSTLNISTIV